MQATRRKIDRDLRTCFVACIAGDFSIQATNPNSLDAVTFSARRRYKPVNSPLALQDSDMSRTFKMLISLICLAPLLANAEMRTGDLPDGTRWYLHADLKQMRESASGGELYGWMNSEIFMEIYDDVGIDINKEADRITAFSSVGRGTIVVLEGNISKETQDKVLALSAAEAKFDTRMHKGKAYYHLQDMKREWHEDRKRRDSKIAFDGLDDEAFFSFAVKNKLIVASTAGEMQAMLDSGGKITGSAAHSGALFVLTADKTFMQAGLKTDDLGNDSDGWQSNIIRNTEQVALLVSESNEQIAVEAQLVSTDPQLAQSIGGIVNGLISLQAFNTELDPEIQTLIRNTRVQVKEKVLSISTVISSKTIVQVLKN